ncbi:hypothetical protein FA13DRAFT_658551 [Coprinellus micaceus]|uniref:Uncharacterized protein n=1 Tax=Coprinellus micaceus TaxID=71717 RepID=A0A4Y7S9W5_COPMI|nr:hypothetical protein FA13DRAFT_658551 [Coprinellus micaceus]
MVAWTDSGSKHLPNSLPPLPLPPPSETKQFRNEATPERWLPNKTRPPQLSPPYRGESPPSSGDTAPLVHRLLTVTSSALIPPSTKPPWTPVQRHPSIPLRRIWRLCRRRRVSSGWLAQQPQPDLIFALGTTATTQTTARPLA